MILLDKDQYEIVTEPLKQITINNLFARSVIEKHVRGSVYVDNVDNPKTFYVVHPYGMSLLFGKVDNERFNTIFFDYALNIHKVRNRFEWMQAFPGAWDATLKAFFQDRLVPSTENDKNGWNNVIELNTRVNFKFNVDKYLAFKAQNIIEDFNIVRTDKRLYEDMKGSVVPMHFWDSADHFCKDGVGFSLLCDDKLASTAYSAFIHDDKLELGIETLEAFRGKGFAQYACSILIDYCLENNYEPIWSCRLENIGSYKLAQKLGFEPTKMIPYYRLCD